MAEGPPSHKVTVSLGLDEEFTNEESTAQRLAASATSFSSAVGSKCAGQLEPVIEHTLLLLVMPLPFASACASASKNEASSPTTV